MRFRQRFCQRDVRILMSERENDLKMLGEVITHYEGEVESGRTETDAPLADYVDNMLLAFRDMRDRLNERFHQLTDKQREWVRREKDKIAPEYEGDLVSSGKVPRGREVATLPVLDPAKLPKRPPSRRA